jgi:hypothetical protein
MGSASVISNERPRYWDGQEVHAGDRVNHAGQSATVVFVVGPNEFLNGFEPSDWASVGPGFMVRQDDGQLFFYGEGEGDEDTDLIHRMPNQS